MRKTVALLVLMLFAVGCGTITVLKEPSFTDAAGTTYRHVNVHTTNTNVIAPSTDMTRSYLCVSQPDDQAVEIVVHGEDAGDIGSCNPVDTNDTKFASGRGFMGATGAYAIGGGLAYGLSRSGDTNNLSNNSGSSAFSGANARSSAYSRANARANANAMGGGMPMD